MPSTEDIKYYEDLQKMFETDGWKVIVNETAAEITSVLNTMANETEFGAIRELQGKLRILDRIVHLEELAKNSYDALVEDEKNAEVEDDNL